jgi:MFS family permease
MQPTGHNVRLFTTFAVLYFVQGIVEPTACLPYQPVQSQLTAWEFSAKEIGHFFGLIGVAWSIKPLFGLISDFLPIGGRRRKPYLILAGLAVAAAFLILAATRDSSSSPGGWWFHALLGASPGRPSIESLGWLLAAVGIGVAMSDVVIDALAVETGQPRGITGPIQSVQWTALSLAGILAGIGGGYVAEHKLQQPMFALCGLLTLVSLAVIVIFVQEPRLPGVSGLGVPGFARRANPVSRFVPFLSVAAFLFLWNFNPFSSNVLQQYGTEELKLSEQQFGFMLTIQSVGSIVACLAYGWYCRRLPFGWLLHGSIVAGIASTLTYWLFRDWPTAIAASFIFGLAWQTGVLVQLDLAARICPLSAAGTTFALLMAITNTGQSAGIFVGGAWYDSLTTHFNGNRHLAFHTLVAIGATVTAACWLLVPALTRSAREGNRRTAA